MLKERDEKLADAQKAQADIIRKQRDLDDAKRELDLTVEKRIDEGLTEARASAKREAEERLQLKPQGDGKGSDHRLDATKN